MGFYPAKEKFMARIKPVKNTPLNLRIVNWFSKHMFGQQLANLQYTAHNPSFVRAHIGMKAFFQAKSKLDPSIRALAIHYVSELNQCAWCIDFGRAKASKQGLNLEKLAALHKYDDDPRFSSAERAALSYAEATTKTGIPVTDEHINELKKHFSDREIVELVAAVAAISFDNRINISLGIESQGFCSI